MLISADFTARCKAELGIAVAIKVVRLSVCLSVRPSVTLMYRRHRLEYREKGPGLGHVTIGLDLSPRLGGTQWRILRFPNRHLFPSPFFPAPPLRFPYFPSLPLRSKRLEIQLGVWGSAASTVSFPVGSGAEDQPKSNLVHFSPQTKKI